MKKSSFRNDIYAITYLVIPPPPPPPPTASPSPGFNDPSFTINDAD